VGGRPGCGKTAFGLQVAQNVARQGVRVAFFSAEMSTRALLRRAAAEFTAIPTFIADKPGPLADERQRMMRDRYVEQVAKDLSKLEVYVDDYSKPTIQYMRETIDRLGDIGLVVFDYLSLGGDTGKSEVEKISAISLYLQRLAKDFDIPVVALSQLNRSVEHPSNKATGYRPALAHIRDSGQVEANAHNVILLYRRLYYVHQGMLDSEPGETDVMSVHVAKHREGETGVIRLRFDGPTFRLSTTND
jgi:replicative DNA helicase